MAIRLRQVRIASRIEIAENGRARKHAGGDRIPICRLHRFRHRFVTGVEADCVIAMPTIGFSSFSQPRPMDRANDRRSQDTKTWTLQPVSPLRSPVRIRHPQ